MLIMLATTPTPAPTLTLTLAPNPTLTPTLTRTLAPTLTLTLAPTLTLTLSPNQARAAPRRLPAAADARLLRTLPQAARHHRAGRKGEEYTVRSTQPVTATHS